MGFRFFRRPVAAALVALLLPAAPATAQETPDSGPPAAATGGMESLSEAQKAALDRIESYYNGITTLRARFTQTSSGGGLAEGTLHLKKPGRMRVAYDPPSDILMVATGQWLIYYDAEVEQVSYVDPEETPLALLLRETIAFDDPRVELAGMTLDDSVVRVTMTRAEDPGAGHLTLVFQRDPMRFRQWQVRDAQGTVTTVQLQALQTGMSLSESLFDFDGPDRPGQGGG